MYITAVILYMYIQHTLESVTNGLYFMPIWGLHDFRSYLINI